MTARPRLLLTGFGPFPGAPDNPTGPMIRALARRLRKQSVAVSTHVFETTYAAVDRELPRLLTRMKPDTLLMFGLANKARHLRIETKARNRITRFPDASFAIPESRKIAEGGVRSRPIRAPKAALLRAAKSGGLPARLSVNAGDYLCNYLYWYALAAAGKSGGPVKAAFIHVPLPSKQLTLDRMILSAEAIALALLQATRKTRARPR
ncbi:MAG: pyroglutamyl-peptidase I [Pseudorhodoplanes sp.]